MNDYPAAIVPVNHVEPGPRRIRAFLGGEQILAWAYDFPTLQLLPIAGLIAFYNEKADIFLDGQPLERPRTQFS